MITTLLPNTSPYIYTSLGSTILESVTLASFKPTTTNDICPCDFPELKECPQVVFADITSADWWKNDQRDFLYKKSIATDTITIKLYKAGIEVAAITDNTYGQYEPDLAPIQSLYVYFLLDFQAVATLLGFGQYQIKTDISIMGVADTIESELFQLLPYSDTAAHDTVVVETIQNGNIMRSPFDYTGLNLYHRFRIPGRLTKEAGKDTRNYVTQDYKFSQIQDKIIDTWTIETLLIPAIISNQLIYNDELANEYLVTDYNVHAHELYRRVPLYPTEIAEDTNYSGNNKKSYLLKFTDEFDNIIKRNY